ncbi:MAG: hypothetical protein IPP13_06055 [Kouleothrix sp.]|jgi:hypothetical protein|nr:hypothetical protein [Kouleothrix sp.]
MIIQHKHGALALPTSRRALRRGLAFTCFVLGVAGCVLPIIPGLPFFVLGGRLLGPRDRTLRHGVLLGRRQLRRLRGSRLPLLRRAGATLTPHWRQLTRMMVGSR